MDENVVIERQAPKVITPTGQARCGVAEVDITPHVGIAMAGYAAIGKVAKGIRGRLFARALYLEDATGNCAALCVLDLMSGSRYLLERTASSTAALSGISVDRLILAGTHTHTAPGHFYGNDLYDAFAQCQPGFDLGLADWLAGRIAQAVNQAAATAVPAQVAVTVRALWGIARNRSLPAFQRNRDAARWHDAGWPGHGAPAGLSAMQRAVDPRVTVLTAVRRDTGHLLGVFATFGCHTTTLGSETDVYAPDWAGHAVREARHQLTGTGETPPIVAVGTAAAGDINGLQDDRDQGPGLARFVGSHIGSTIAEAAQDGRARATDFTVSIRYTEPRTTDHRVDGRADTALAEQWSFGAPVLGGAEDGRSLLHRLGLVFEGMTDRIHFKPSHPQSPKAPILGVLQQFVVDDLLDLDPSPVLPMHALTVAGHLFVTVPGEPTAMAAHQIERTLRDATGLTGVTVFGYAADYSGYFTTEEEFRAQHYEGAHNLYGRNATRHLSARLRHLVTGPAPAPITSGTVTFPIGNFIRNFSPTSAGRGGREPRPHVIRKGLQVELQWHMPVTFRACFAEEYFVRLEERRQGRWRPLQQHGHDFDDRSEDIAITRRTELFDWFGGQATWTVELQLPKEPTADSPLRLRVAPRAQFDGFTLPIA
jgi:neutral ceramidase